MFLNCSVLLLYALMTFNYFRIRSEATYFHKDIFFINEYLSYITSTKLFPRTIFKTNEIILVGKKKAFRQYYPYEL